MGHALRNPGDLRLDFQRHPIRMLANVCARREEVVSLSPAAARDVQPTAADESTVYIYIIYKIIRHSMGKKRTKQGKACGVARWMGTHIEESMRMKMDNSLGRRFHIPQSRPLAIWQRLDLRNREKKDPSPGVYL